MADTASLRGRNNILACRQFMLQILLCFDHPIAFLGGKEAIICHGKHTPGARKGALEACAVVNVAGDEL
jgi:hypothetical protein